MDEINENDAVTVKNNPHGTIYIVTKVFPNGNCKIRQDGLAPNGQNYTEQMFDLSLLRRIK